jgi:hypothetical protein
LILEVWQRVSEDFAPFDVDVTTQDPGVNAIRRSSARDNTYGTRVAIATDPDITCTCGGLASMGAFDTYSSSDPRAHDRAQPVWVFPGSLSNAKDVAEAASHEVGHTLGLSHDGTTQPVENAEYYRGQGAWAPLMGVGYYRPLTQWSDGDYGTATNTEDDISVMISSGLALIPDDHADGAADATPLPGGHLQTATGVIGTREDVDWFEFRVGGGPTQITVDPATVGANLDVRLRVARRTGEILRTISPVSIMLGEQTVTGLNAQVALNLTPGTYRLAVDGVGDDDPAFGGFSDYGSLGAYTVTVQTSGLTVATPVLPTALVNRSYAARLSADDDVDGGESGGEVTWAIVAGSLPQGLTLTPSGVLSGTPVTRGTSTITVQVSNGVRIARATLPLHVISPLRVVESTPVTGYVDRPWSTPVPARGGLGPLTFALSSGRLPRGTKLHDSGVISGQPSREESGSADITVTDQRGRTVTATVTWSIYPQIDIATDRLPRGTVGDSYQLSLLASGGAGDLRWTVIRGSLPPGLRMSRSGVLRGVPRAQGTWTARLRASDGTIMDQRRLTLRIRR